MSNLKLVQVQTTPSCNAKCSFCPHKNSIMSKRSGLMPIKDYEDILDKIKRYDPDFSGRFCPYLMNEPFVDKRLEDLVELAYQKLPKMELEISTNAELLTPERSSKLVDIIRKYNRNVNTRIKISLHGISNDMIKDIMDINPDKAINNIKELIDYSNGDVNIIIWGLGESDDHSVRYFNGRKYIRFMAKNLGDIKGKNVLIRSGVFQTIPLVRAATLTIGITKPLLSRFLRIQEPTEIPIFSDY